MSEGFWPNFDQMNISHRRPCFFSIIISSFDINLSKSLISRKKKKLYIIRHHVSALCLTQLDSISLSQKVDLHINLSISVTYLAVHLFTLALENSGS